MEGHGQKLSAKQESVIAALLTEPTNAAAAAKAGVGETTLYRWMRIPAFQVALRKARRKLLESTIGRLQAASGLAVDALTTIVQKGRRDGDRIRASITLLDQAQRGLEEADTLHDPPETQGDASMGTADIVQLLAKRLRQIDASDLPTSEKARLTATIADALLRAYGVDVMDKRFESLQTVLKNRKEKKKK